MFNFKLVKFALSAAAFAGALAAGTATASAAGGSTLGCTVYELGDDTGGSPTRLTLHCLNDGNNYTVDYGGTCAVVSIEQEKLWESMIMAALLSGKKLNLWWDNACGSRALTSVYVETQ